MLVNAGHCWFREHRVPPGSARPRAGQPGTHIRQAVLKRVGTDGVPGLNGMGLLQAVRVGDTGAGELTTGGGAAPAHHGDRQRLGGGMVADDAHDAVGSDTLEDRLRDMGARLARTWSR